MTIKAGEVVAMSVGVLIGLGALIGGIYLIINKSGNKPDENALGENAPDENEVVPDRVPIGHRSSSYNENNPGFGGGALFLKKGGSRNKRRRSRKTRKSRKTKKSRKGRIRRRTNKR